jgi:hypothetical protein
MIKKRTSVTFRNALKRALDNVGVISTSIGLELDTLSDLDILFRLEKAWPALTNIKSFANFIKNDLGIGNGRCVIVIVDTSDLIAEIMRTNLHDVGDETLLITVASTYKEGHELINYYAAMKSLCVLITDLFLDSLDESNHFDFDRSGLSLIVEAKRKASFHGTWVYCVVISSIGGASEITGEAMRRADLYVPLKYAAKSLKTLVERQVDEREQYGPTD